MEYRIWAGIKKRCINLRCPAYKNYGGRGIQICDRWRDSFPAFLADMGRRPAGMSVERIDNDGNYEPGNCKWAAPLEQARNCRKNHLVTANGESLPISVWAERLGIRSETIRHRLHRGYTDLAALFAPLGKRLANRKERQCQPHKKDTG